MSNLSKEEEKRKKELINQFMEWFSKKEGREKDSIIHKIEQFLYHLEKGD